ncbi:MAG: hypothetical protein FJ146_13210 [Deltaproteobacteria bacterium]|nr:hypothetical protein [Deltaproteobacteria bacterium]
MPSKIREEQYDRMERRVDNHDHRIGALEVTVRVHVGEHERSKIGRPLAQVSKFGLLASC